MDELYRQHLLIASQLRAAGSACDYSVVLPVGACRCKDDEVLSVTLQSFSAVRSWASMPATNVVFTVGASTSTISLEAGNPSNAQLAIALSTNTLGVSCRWDSVNNSLVFSSAAAFSFTCDPAVGVALGFPLGSSGAAATKVQGQTMQSLQIDNVCVHLKDVMPWDAVSNYRTVQGFGTLQPTTMLCCFAAEGSPYTHIRFSNNNDDFSLAIDDRELNVIHLQLTDVFGQPLTQLGEHVLVLRVCTLKQKSDEMAELQQQTNSILKDTLYYSLYPEH